ncbi:MAG: hypothetical protein NT010_03790 [Proteobacteria bacterium]|nr:hypothetical protein [Pseudomonadota bacterium]
MKRSKYFFIALVCLFSLTCVWGVTPAEAVRTQPPPTITDLNTSDLNSIVSQQYWYDINTGKYILTVHEDYNEVRIIPYPSHDGYAIVNPQGGFFEKEISNVTGGGLNLQFVVTNTTPYTWSDYHFLLMTEGATYNDSTGNTHSNPFVDGGFRDLGYPYPYNNNRELMFFSSTDWPAHVSPGDTANFYFTITDPNNDPFTIWQVATTSVPIPGAILLFGPGLAGIALLRKRMGRRG